MTKTFTPIAMLSSTLPDPTVEFKCFECGTYPDYVKKEPFFRNQKLQYKLTCPIHGVAWVQL